MNKNMSRDFNKHPVFLNRDQIVDICAPLKKMDITYFCHVNINEKGEFSGISNNPEFAEHYIKNEYYNADIHLTSKELGGYILWDALPKCGQTEQMDQEAQQFGLRHTFTIVKENEKTKDYFHFATHLNQDWFNQVYLTNLDLLNNFSEYFKEKIQQSKMLSIAYDYTFVPNEEDAEFCIQLDEFLPMREKRLEIVNLLNGENGQVKNIISPETVIIHRQTGKILRLAPQQMRCLTLLIAGKTSKEIGIALGISYRTVEHYIHRIRGILGCKSSKEVIASYSVFGAGS
jgi:DNA-binding CsgD family transcriptional regulator